VRAGTAPLERAQEMFERLESPSTTDVKILLQPSFGSAWRPLVRRS
jgi:hypothetical protein